MVPPAKQTRMTSQAAPNVYNPHEVHARHHMRDQQLSGKQTPEFCIKLVPNNLPA